MQTGYVDHFSPVVAGLSGRTVMQIIPSLGFGGAERIVLALAAALANVGARSLVACEDGGMVSELQAKGGIWLPFPAKAKNPISIALNVQKLTQLMRLEGVDLIHAHSRAPAWAAFGASKRTQKPFVTTFHSSYEGGGRAKSIYNSVMARSDAIVTHSKYTAALISQDFPEIQGKVRVISAGIDFHEYSPAMVSAERVSRVREDWGVAAHEHIVLLPARLAGTKDHRTLLEAAKILTERGLSQTKFVLTGEVPARSAQIREMDALIIKYQLQECVRQVSPCIDLPASFLSAALVVVPSTEAETFGLTSVEAQALGTPVIVSNAGAVAETISVKPNAKGTRRTGWHVPPNNPKELAEVILKAISLGASAKDAISSGAREHVIHRFALEQMMSETMDLYAALIR